MLYVEQELRQSYSLEEFRRDTQKFVECGCEPEVYLVFDHKDDEYMVIAYPGGRYSFQGESAQEVLYPDFDTFINATLIDDICLIRDWDKLDQVNYNWPNLDELDDIVRLYEERKKKKANQLK